MLIRFALLALCGLLLASPSPVTGQGCEVGLRLGATLLFPYFEVDLEAPDGATTLISINNSASQATLARTVVWTTTATVALAFDMILGPNGVETINLRDLLAGRLPATSDPALLGFTSCGSNPPPGPGFVLSAADLTFLRSNLAGKGCLGGVHPVESARGFITVDTVRMCSGIATPTYRPYGTPEQSDYFLTHTTTDNVLWGDLLLVNPHENSAQGMSAIPLRADPSRPPGSQNTFYGRFHQWSGLDKRSPLPTTWLARFLNGGAFDGGTELIVFRDPRVISSQFPCRPPNLPSWYPLSAMLTERDEAGNALGPPRDTQAFGYATQKVRVSELLSPSAAIPFGQLEITTRLPGNPALPGSWVFPLLSASGRFSVGMSATPRDAPCW